MILIKIKKKILQKKLAFPDDLFYEKIKIFYSRLILGIKEKLIIYK
jgi:hypothetical protein